MKSLVALLAFATLAVPAVAASPVDDLLWQTDSEVRYATGQATLLVESLPGFGGPTPEETPPAEESPPAHEEPANGHGHEDDQAASPSSEPAPPAPFAPLPRAVEPVSRLVPVPVTDVVGPLPLIDVGAIARAVRDAAPLAPASAPPARASAAPAASVEVAAASARSVELAPVAPELVVAGVVATAGAAASVGGASALWDRLRRLGFLGALLYSRIAKERLLDHGTREALLETIRQRPGLAVADLAVASTIPRNTVTYHLRVLERESLVSSTRNGRNRLYFAPGSLEKRGQADALATLRHETTLAVAKAIGASPGVDQKGICGSLGLSPSLAHWHADRLVTSGLVEKRRDGRFVRYYPGGAFELVTARSA